MSVQILQQRLRDYACRTAQEEEQALREITQELILAALGRTGFFSQAAFHGGTCLRIFHQLNRFSEDLDFVLKKPVSSFELGVFLIQVAKELEAYGYALEIQERSSLETPVKKAFLKDDSIGRILELHHLRADRFMKKIRIRLEIDTNPPEGAVHETAYLNFPFLSSVTIHDSASLFAGKIHALLCREYLKGRDWYDFLWYAARRTKVNTTLLSHALMQSGPWKGKTLSVDDDWLLVALNQRINSIDWPQAARDVQRFLKPQELPSLSLWTRDVFRTQAASLFLK